MEQVEREAAGLDVSRSVSKQRVPVMVELPEPPASEESLGIAARRRLREEAAKTRRRTEDVQWVRIAENILKEGDPR
jgi:hypothetical protein